MMLVYMLDPNKLLAFNYQMTPEELSYIPDNIKTSHLLVDGMADNLEVMKNSPKWSQI